MGKRSTARRLAMQVMYQLELNPSEEISEVLDHTMENDSFPEDTNSFALALVRGAWEHRLDADELIKKRSIGWALERINMIDRSILRLSIYELKHTDTPQSVIINEAVNLAKRYGTEDSSRFINGILGGLVDEQNSGKVPRAAARDEQVVSGKEDPIKEA